jgi:hypothetical protein
MAATKHVAQLAFSSRKEEMTKIVDGTKVPHHGLFYMENAGGCDDEEPETSISVATGERQASCFGLEEERGEDWKGSGAMKSVINDSRPSL